MGNDESAGKKHYFKVRVFEGMTLLQNLIYDKNQSAVPFVSESIAKNFAAYSALESNGLFLQLFYRQLGASETGPMSYAAAEAKLQSFDSISPQSDIKVDPTAIRGVIYIDFSNVPFLRFGHDNRLDALEGRLHDLFTRGFDLVNLEGLNRKRHCHYEPFDRSGSMSRHSRLSFVQTEETDRYGEVIPNSDVRAYLLPRLHLGLDPEPQRQMGTSDPNSFPLPLAKKIAYDGLMMSGGFPIARCWEAFTEEPAEKRSAREDALLAAQTMAKRILIMPSLKKPMPANAHGISFQKKPGSGNSNLYVLDPAPSFAENDGEINAFDGEGLIGQDLADAVDRSFNDLKGRKHHSFQIRLNGVKGVVHRVDFNGFLAAKHPSYGQEQKLTLAVYDENLKEKSRSDLSVSDLSKVALILDESMFKIGKSLRDFWQRNATKPVENDDLFADGKVTYAEAYGSPMVFYCRKLIQYHENLFVLLMDSPTYDRDHSKTPDPKKAVVETPDPKEFTSINFQYLSTGSYKPHQIEDLFAKSQETFDELAKDPIKALIHDKAIVKDADERSANPSEEIEPEDLDNPHDTALKILEMDHRFMAEPHFQKMVTNEKNQKMRQFGRGNLIVEGGLRLLSGNLLEFLYTLFKETGMPPFPADSFYVPGSRLSPDTVQCALLRNPHVSRDESLLLKPYFPKDNEEYTQFGLNQLTGLAMIDPCDPALPAASIGGADYDGDEVFFVADKTFIAGMYGPDLEKGKGHRQPLINRSLPAAERTYTPDDIYVTIRDAFSGNVGLFSNAGYRASLSAYLYSKANDGLPQPVPEGVVRLCSFLTEIETDAPKTGIHPSTKDRRLEVTDKTTFDNFFLDFKNGLKDKLYFDKKGFFAKYPTLFPLDQLSTAPKETSQKAEESPTEEAEPDNFETAIEEAIEDKPATAAVEPAAPKADETPIAPAASQPLSPYETFDRAFKAYTESVGLSDASEARGAAPTDFLPFFYDQLYHDPNFDQTLQSSFGQFSVSPFSEGKLAWPRPLDLKADPQAKEICNQIAILDDSYRQARKVIKKYHYLENDAGKMPDGLGFVFERQAEIDTGLPSETRQAHLDAIESVFTLFCDESRISNHAFFHAWMSLKGANGKSGDASWLYLQPIEEKKAAFLKNLFCDELQVDVLTEDEKNVLFDFSFDGGRNLYDLVFAAKQIRNTFSVQTGKWCLRYLRYVARTIKEAEANKSLLKTAWPYFDDQISALTFPDDPDDDRKERMEALSQKLGDPSAAYPPFKDAVSQIKEAHYLIQDKESDRDSRNPFVPLIDLSPFAYAHFDPALWNATASRRKAHQRDAIFKATFVLNAVDDLGKLPVAIQALDWKVKVACHQGDSDAKKRYLDMLAKQAIVNLFPKAMPNKERFAYIVKALGESKTRDQSILFDFFGADIYQTLAVKNPKGDNND